MTKRLPSSADYLAKPVSLERLETYLDFLAGVMVDYAPEFDECLPIYERLEREIAERKVANDKMAKIRERVRLSRDQKPVPVS